MRLDAETKTDGKENGALNNELLNTLIARRSPIFISKTQRGHI